MFWKKDTSLKTGGPPDVEATLPATPTESDNLAQLTDAKLVDKGNEILGTLTHKYHDFVAEALAREMSKDQIESAVIDAWNTGNLPRAALYSSYAGSGFVLVLLHGKVPDDLFDRTARGQDAGVITDDTSRLTVVVTERDDPEALQNDYYELPSEPVPDDPDSFWIETVNLAQHTTGAGHIGSIDGRNKQIQGLNRLIDHLDEKTV